MVIISVFLFDEISLHDNQKKIQCEKYNKRFVWKNCNKVAIFEGKFSGVVIFR
jgi:hypothetical protein